MSNTTHHPCDVEDLEYDPSVCRDCGCVLIDDETDLCADCEGGDEA